jgi:acetyl-CoA synthetase (ADP-forming)
VEDAFKLLDKYDIPIPPYVIVHSIKELKSFYPKIDFPVVIKIISSNILHKSEKGGVVIGINNYNELINSSEKLLAKFDGVIEGLLIQKMIKDGIELSIGGIRDDVFGPLVMFGSGGILIELFNDVSFRLAPIDTNKALELIKETKVYKLLQGFRGFPKVDIYTISNLIVNVSKLMWDNKDIRELDINPLIVGENFSYAVDVRVLVDEEEIK